MKMIGLGSISLKHLYPLIYFIVTCSKYGYKSLFFKGYIKQTLFYLSYSLHLIIAIIPYIIEKLMTYSSKRTSNLNPQEQRITFSKSNFTYIQSQSTNKYKLQYYLYFILICLLSLIIICCRWIIYYNLNSRTSTDGKDESHNYIYDNSFFSVCEFILCALISKGLLNLSISSHHVLSFIIIIIGTAFTTSFYVLNYLGLETSETTNDHLKDIIIAAIIKALSGAIQEVCEKWLMEIKFISSYLLLFIEGMFDMTIYGILLLININNKFWPFRGKNQIADDIKNLIKDLPLLYYGIYVSILFGISVFRIKTNENFTPTHKTIGNTMIGMYLFIDFIIDKNIRSKNSWLPFVGYSIVFSGSLIYHEIIILYFCNLDTNTAKEIDQRAINDSDPKTFNITEAYQLIESTNK